MTGKELEALLRSTPVVQQGISHYDALNAPVVLTMVLADGSRVAFVSYDVQYQPAPAKVPASARKPAPTTLAPPGVTQGIGFSGKGINNFKAMQDR